MEPGTVVIVRDGKALVPVVVLADRGKKLDLVRAGGKTTSLPAGRVSLRLDAGYGGRVTADEAGEWLVGWTETLDDQFSEADLELAWELLLESEAEAELDELCELIFGDVPSAAQRAAVFLTLERDSTFFKRRQDSYQPRSAESVEQRRVAERRSVEKQAARAEFLDRLGRAVSEKQAPEATDADREFTDDLLRLALGADEGPEIKRASRILTEVPGLPVTPEGAFRALVALGMLDRDENLALLASGISRHHSSAASDEVDGIPEQHALGDRRDLRELDTFTIDESWTTDQDDALSLVALGDTTRVMIHITHVAAFVPRDSAIDRGAFGRGASVYLPDEKIHMLPESCEGRLALLAGRDRAALTLELTIDAQGTILTEESYPSLIHVDRNMTYDAADELIQAADPTFAALWDTAQRLGAARRDSGAVSFSLPELRVTFDDGAPMLRVVPGETPARQLVAEMMILANAGWARLCSREQVPVVYRKQDAPGKELPSPDEFPSTWVYFFNIRRHLTKGRLSTQAAPHSGLGLPCYLQASSPLRRYQDLATQRQLSAMLDGSPLPYSEEEILRIAAAADTAAREIMRVERERVEHWTCRWLEPRVGQTLQGAVLGDLGEGRYQVLLTEVLREVQMRIDAPVEPGQQVTVKLVGLNVFDRRLHVTFVG